MLLLLLAAAPVLPASTLARRRPQLRPERLQHPLDLQVGLNRLPLRLLALLVVLGQLAVLRREDLAKPLDTANLIYPRIQVIVILSGHVVHLVHEAEDLCVGVPHRADLVLAREEVFEQFGHSAVIEEREFDGEVRKFMECASRELVEEVVDVSLFVVGGELLEQDLLYQLSLVELLYQLK